MKMVQEELIRDGYEAKSDPVKEQYLALAGSITMLCKEPNIVDIVLDYVRREEQIWEAGRDRQKQLQMQIIKEQPVTACLEVLVHIIKNLAGLQTFDTEKLQPKVLVKLIAMARKLFAEDLVNPNMIKSFNSSQEDVAVLFKTQPAATKQ